MKTKLVYVLTCSDENLYLEQALMSVFSARHHNPEAHIVLIVDDQTDKVIDGNRAEILQYIDEKIVVPFKGEMSMVKRSRWIKTKVRHLIEGDYLYIDCDTIIRSALKQIDLLECQIGAVPDSHLEVSDFCAPLYEKISLLSKQIGWVIDKEQFYFSSGVIFVKDNANTRNFYELWHSYWQEGLQKGIAIDQPSFAKANIAMQHIVEKISDKWNCVMYTEPDFSYNAYILHFPAYRNPSFLFSKRVLDKIKKEGLKNKFIRQCVIAPDKTYVPFDNKFFKNGIKFYLKTIRCVATQAKHYSKNIDPNFEDFIVKSKFSPLIKWHFKNNLFFPGSILFVLWKFFRIKFSNNFFYTPNTCQK
jgi:hypothetical protein